jgi:hypothetical protein
VPQNHRAPQSSCPTIGGADLSEIAFRTLHIYRGDVSTPSSPFTPALQLRRPSPFILALGLHSSTLHSRPALRRHSLLPFTLALYCAALHPSFRRFSPFAPAPFTHSVALHPSLRLSSPLTPPPFTPALHCAAIHSCPSLWPFTAPPFTLHSAAFHPSLPHPSLTLSPFTLHSASLHPSLRLSSPLTPPPFTPALHRAALYRSFCRSLPFNPPPFTPPPPPYTPPPVTPPPLAPSVACHDLCDFRIVRLVETIVGPSCRRSSESERENGEVDCCS